jgi:hypothetical protein
MIKRNNWALCEVNVNQPLITVEEIKREVIKSFGRDWMFTMLKTGGWREEMTERKVDWHTGKIWEPRPTGNIRFTLDNGSHITLVQRPGGVRMYVHACWMRGWTTPGQMRFNPRPSTVKYTVDAIRQTTVVEDFDLLKV